MGAVLAAQVFDLIVVLAPQDACVVARDLPIVEHDVAIGIASDGQRLAFQWPDCAGFAAALQDQHGRFALSERMGHGLASHSGAVASLDSRAGLGHNQDGQAPASGAD